MKSAAILAAIVLALPDPFELTGTAFASPPRTWQTQRRVKAEIRRIKTVNIVSKTAWSALAAARAFVC